MIPRLGRSPGEGHGNPLQYSYLENPVHRGALWAPVHGVAKSRTRLSDSHTHTHTIYVCICIIHVYTNTPHLYPFICCGHLGCFHFSAIVNHAQLLDSRSCSKKKKRNRLLNYHRKRPACNRKKGPVVKIAMLWSGNS